MFCVFWSTDFIRAQQSEVLGVRGGWEAITADGSFDGAESVCTIRSVNKIDGGRRQRPRIRVEPGNSKLTIDPEIYLTGVLTAIAVIEERSSRPQPKRVLVHRMRVDRGLPLGRKFADPRHGIWKADAATNDPTGFIAQMRRGKQLVYEWKLDRARKLYRFDLNGFAELYKIVLATRSCATDR